MPAPAKIHKLGFVLYIIQTKRGTRITFSPPIKACLLAVLYTRPKVMEINTPVRTRVRTEEIAHSLLIRLLFSSETSVSEKEAISILSATAHRG